MLFTKLLITIQVKQISILPIEIKIHIQLLIHWQLFFNFCSSLNKIWTHIICTLQHQFTIIGRNYLAPLSNQQYKNIAFFTKVIPGHVTWNLGLTCSIHVFKHVAIVSTYIYIYIYMIVTKLKSSSLTHLNW